MTRRLQRFGVCLAFCLSVGALEAHHSLPALFDVSATVSVSGEVTEFEFVAPHGYIHVNVEDDNGQITAWELETYPPGMLFRKGLTPQTLQPGDRISATGIPARDGRALMRLLVITMPDGEERQIQ